MSGAGEIEVSYTPKLAHYIEAHYLVSGLKRIDYAWRVVFTLSVISIFFYLAMGGELLVASIMLVAGAYVCFRVEAQLTLNFLFNKEYSHPIRLRFSEWGVDHQAKHPNRFSWDYFQSMHHNKRVLVLLMGKTASIVIPKTVLSAETVSSLYGLVERKLAKFPSLISPNGARLAAESGKYNVRFVDASWFMPSDNHNPSQEYAEKHILGSVFFDIEQVRDTASPLPHMLPHAAQFAETVGGMGISHKDAVVVYDSAGLFSAARVWWMFRVFGHRHVAVLDGGLPRWERAGLPVNNEIVENEPSEYRAGFNHALVRNLQQMVSNLPLKVEQVVDARSEGRFSGSEKEPRDGLASGHIPGSCNVHYKTLINPDGTLKSPNELREVFAAAGVNLEKPVITTCGSGVTACIIALALDVLGKVDVAVYDGSWAEWGASGQPVDTGLAAYSP